MYAFVFDKRSMSRLVVGTMLAAVLLVFAGVLIGLRLNLPQDATQVAVAPTRPASDGPRRVPPSATTPPPPVIRPSPPAIAPPPPVTTPPPVTVPPPATAPSVTAPSATAPPPPVIASPSRAALQPSATELASFPPVPTTPSPAIAAKSSLPGIAFAIQVAAFTLDANARNEVSTLAARGYEPYILSARRADGKPILRVVIGSYASRQEASRAAARFTSEEQRESLVRPVAEI